MKNLIILIIIITISILLSFGSWYAIVWFFTNETNGLYWKWWVKIFYIVISFYSYGNFSRDLKSKYIEQ